MAQTVESVCNVGEPGLIPGLERSHEEGNGNPLQYSCLENPMDREIWRAIVHGVTRASKPPPFQDYLYHNRRNLW